VTTWRALLEDATRGLDGGDVARPAVDARRIVEEAAGCADGAWVLVAEREAPLVAARRVQEMVSRRRRGEPLQYVLGSWSFLGLDLFVDHRVLIPRPETERTVEVAFEEAARLGLRRGPRDPWRGTSGDAYVADLGTGSGAIALALARELPDAEVWATDHSPGALAVARANVAGTAAAATRVRVAEGDWFDALPREHRGAFQLIVSNPPYIADAEFAGLPAVVAGHEPKAALVSGPTGLEAIEALVAGASDYLMPGAGTLVVEVAPHQAATAVALARRVGFADAHAEPDLAGRDRVLVARGGG
jgi:release factor glutamine methyltransferase